MRSGQVHAHSAETSGREIIPSIDTLESGTVPAVERAAAILQLLATTTDPIACTVSQISRALHLNKSTCSNILRTLQNAGLTEYLAQSKSYRLGVGLIGLAAAASRGRNFPAAAMPTLATLAQGSGFTCAAFEQLDSGDFLVLQKVEGSRTIRATIDVGQLFPPAAPAFSRLRLAWLPQGAALSYYGQWGAPAFTERTVTALPDILQELDRVRQRGVSTIHGEYTLAHTVIAAPVFSNAPGRCRGIFLVAFSSEIDEAELPVLENRVQKAASEITSVLGGVHPA